MTNQMESLSEEKTNRNHMCKRCTGFMKAEATCDLSNNVHCTRASMLPCGCMHVVHV